MGNIHTPKSLTTSSWKMFKKKKLKEIYHEESKENWYQKAGNRETINIEEKLAAVTNIVYIVFSHESNGYM
jgi:hypothetical protein